MWDLLAEVGGNDAAAAAQATDSHSIELRCASEYLVICAAVVVAAARAPRVEFLRRMVVPPHALRSSSRLCWGRCELPCLLCKRHCLGSHFVPLWHRRVYRLESMSDSQRYHARVSIWLRKRRRCTLLGSNWRGLRCDVECARALCELCEARANSNYSLLGISNCLSVALQVALGSFHLFLRPAELALELLALRFRDEVGAVGCAADRAAPAVEGVLRRDRDVARHADFVSAAGLHDAAIVALVLVAHRAGGGFLLRHTGAGGGGGGAAWRG